MGMEHFDTREPKQTRFKGALPPLLQRFLDDENEKNDFSEVAINFARYAKAVGSAGLAASMVLGTPEVAEARPQKTIEKVIERFENVNAPLTEQDIDVLAKNVYREAGGESARGQLAVLQVTIARALDPREEFGDGSIHGTVYKKNQFSWTRDIDPEAEKKMEASSAFKSLRAFIAFALTNRNKTEVVQTLSSLTKVRADSLFYKRTDWDENDPNEKRMGDTTKNMFKSFVVDETIDHHTFYNEHPRK